MGAAFETVRRQLNVKKDGTIYRDDKPTQWVMLQRGENKHRAILRGSTDIDDRNSCSVSAELDRLAEIIAGSEL